MFFTHTRVKKGVKIVGQRDKKPIFKSSCYFLKTFYQSNILSKQNFIKTTFYQSNILSKQHFIKATFIKATFQSCESEL
jgi:uncharacterized protein YqgQ